MKLIEMIKNVEHNPDFQKHFEAVVAWNAVSGKLEDEKAIENQPALIEEEYRELVEATTYAEMIDACVDIFVTAAMEFYNKFGEYNNEFRPDIVTIASGVDLIGTAIDMEEHWRVYPLIESILRMCKFDVDGALEEVNKSNWSKFANVKDFDNDEVYMYKECERIESLGRYKDVYFEVVEHEGEQLVVFKDGNEKILKPFSFVEADFEQFVNAF